MKLFRLKYHKLFFGKISYDIIIDDKALGFKKEKLLQALGLHFSFLSIFLGLSNSQFNNYLAKELLLISFLSCIFAFLGMYVGNYFTKNINEKTFKNLFLYSLIVLGFLLTLKIYIFH